MPQGMLKKTTGQKPKALAPLKRRGSRIIKPKKPLLIKKKKLVQKHSSGLTGLTERALAERAGHLEILEGGKKSKKEEAAKEGAAKEKQKKPKKDGVKKKKDGEEKKEGEGEEKTEKKVKKRKREQEGEKKTEGEKPKGGEKPKKKKKKKTAEKKTTEETVEKKTTTDAVAEAFPCQRPNWCVYRPGPCRNPNRCQYPASYTPEGYLRRWPTRTTEYTGT
ncbi:hypothetical protein EJ06DRAFT_546408 [Trichodelitschia bisporula]|uniref:Uncharacterized protein n=1 Tax=Trichodelitschia bisporula TaxID=703511 RepID=A0A6G1I8B8_9PEZI|nr:hypothetical protein EJ06DRAFT_546408 [Trichodelitschia bisporula]